MSAILSRDQMRKVSLTKIQTEATDLYDDIWAAARRLNRDVKLYLHWTAGRYGQFWNDYHIQIDADGAAYIPRDITLASVLNATYMRNSGSIAIALLCCYDATTNSGLGKNPPTTPQIETAARIVAVLSAALDLSIDIERVMTHGEAADNEDGLHPGYESNGYPYGMYGPKHSVERWDLEYLGIPESPVYEPNGEMRGGDILRGKAAWYRHTYPDGVEKNFE